MSNDQKYEAFVWLEGLEPQPVEPDLRFIIGFQAYEAALMHKLETFSHGKIARALPDGEMALHYRAFTDPIRGRQVATGLSATEADLALAKKQEQLNVRCFTPRQLYALKPVHVYYDLGHFLSIHVPEIDKWGMDTALAEGQRAIEIRALAEACEDGRRTWSLQTVWFLGNPVMVVNSSGRDDDEYHERYITDRPQFERMLIWLRTFIRDKEIDGVADIDKVIPAMTEFYGATIHDYYDVDKQEKI